MYYNPLGSLACAFDAGSGGPGCCTVSGSCFGLAAWVNGWLSHVKYKKGLHVQHAKTYHTCKYTCIFSKRCIFLFINLCTYLPNNDVNRLR